MENYAGLIEMLFFYGIAISFGVWQWWKMRREVREMRAEREARERAEAEAATPSDAPSPAASDTAA
ncbi:hypothetical protein [uncultured Erythrobacter sp.]|uniref:hypothetical protein n=1 Tax=uncultured Erythrobacter sp. TaxID=263913 RepID=UPI0026138E2C|nr:hypothetical protein [uncultured Erythrobacter sp.]